MNRPLLPALAAALWLWSAPVAAQDAPAFTEGEIDILQSLAEQRRALERLEAAVTEREVELSGVEQRIDGKIARFGRLRCEIIGMVLQLRQTEDERKAKLRKIFESMKAKDSARIFNGMEPELAVSIALDMRERKLSQMMGRMRAPAARDLTRLLARARADQLSGAVAAEPVLNDDRCAGS